MVDKVDGERGEEVGKEERRRGFRFHWVVLLDFFFVGTDIGGFQHRVTILELLEHNGLIKRSNLLSNSCTFLQNGRPFT